MSDFEFMEKYGEDESIYLDDSELEKLQEDIDLNEKIEIMEKFIKEQEEVIKKLKKKLEEEDGKDN